MDNRPGPPAASALLPALWGTVLALALIGPPCLSAPAKESTAAPSGPAANVAVSSPTSPSAGAVRSDVGPAGSPGATPAPPANHIANPGGAASPASPNGSPSAPASGPATPSTGDGDPGSTSSANGPAAGGAAPDASTAPAAHSAPPAAAPVDAAAAAATNSTAQAHRTAARPVRREEREASDTPASPERRAEKVRYVEVQPVTPGRPWQDKLIASAVLGALLGLLWLLLPVLINRTVRDVNLRYYVRKDSRLAVGMALVLGLAPIWIESSHDLGIGLGVFSAGTAFALQEVIASFAGWLVICTTRSIRVGDRIEVGGVKGDVIDIGVLRTSVMELGAWITGEYYSGRIVQVSNATVFKGPLYNYSRAIGLIWDEVKITVPLASNWIKARDILKAVGDLHAGPYVDEGRVGIERMANSYLFEQVQVEPTVVLFPGTGSLAGSLDLALRYLVDLKVRRRIKDQIIADVLERLATDAPDLGTTAITVKDSEAAAPPSDGTAPPGTAPPGTPVGPGSPK